MRLNTLNVGHWLAMVLLLLGFSGCATGQPPTEQISNAELAVDRAEESEATVYAPVELQMAREKLRQAREAVDERELEEARLLAERAYVDARLAEAKARTAQTKQVTQELRESIETLRMEIERKSVIERE